MKDRIQMEDKKTNMLGSILFKYLPYWPLFLLLLIFLVGGAYIYLRYTTPLYQATARLMIKDENKGSEDAKALEALNILSPKKIIENEIEVIQSGTLINQTVKDLGLYAQVMEEGKIHSVSAYLFSPISIEAYNPDGLQHTPKVPFEMSANGSKIAFDGKQFDLNTWVETPYGKLRFVKNKNKIQPDSKKGLYFLLTKPESVAGIIQSRLQVNTASKLSSILHLTLKDEVPIRGEHILNQLLANYSKAMIDDKNHLGANTLAFVEDRIGKVEHDLDSIERHYEQYRASRGAIDIGAQGQLYLENVSSNDQKLSEINMRLAVLNQVETYVQSKNSVAGIVPSTLGVNDVVLTQLVEKLYNSELEYESLKKTTAENNPMLLSLADRISRLKPSILENVQNQRKGLIASKNDIASTNNAYSSILRKIPETQRTLIDISREQNIKNEIYTFLLKKREEAALSQASTVSDSRVVDKAQSSNSPISPKPKVIYLSAFLTALILGVCLVTAKESFSGKVMFRHEIEELTQFPIIGEISSNNSKDIIVIGESKKTFIAEQFRKLRISLNFIGINSKRKRILVTSTMAGEGKSFIAANLALSLAIGGKKVLLLDFDLNNPSLNDKLNIENQKGVTDYLLGESEFEDIILKTNLHPNFYVTPTGLLPNNPSELLMNGKAEDLLNEADALFDYVVIDTAPVGPVTDAYILSPLCDATLFVVRHKYTPKTFVERIDVDNKINSLSNVAIVFNGVTARGFGKKAFGYGYGYGYIYQNQEHRKGLRV